MRLTLLTIIFCALLFATVSFVNQPQKEIFVSPSFETQDITYSSPPAPLSPDKEPAVTPPTKQPTSLDSTKPILKENTTPVTSPPPLITPVAQPLPQKILLPQNFIYKKGLESVVNFLCEQSDGRTTIATGVIISPNGYVLTNAHIVDELKSKTPSCTIRRGSPATNYDTAQLVWIPKAYTATTSESVRAMHDITLWKLKQNTQTPFFDIDYETHGNSDETLLTLSYPAELLSAEIIFKSLHLVFSNTVIVSADQSIIRSRSTLSAQHGSSGGVLIDPYTSRIRGIIFGVNKTETISDRQLFALTPTAINNAVFEETQKKLTDFLAGNP
ncbi:MAG: serine protease [Patescibacteria group bacterium]